MEILIQDGSIFLIIGNLIMDIAIAIFAFSIWFIDRLNSKYRLLINSYRSDNLLNDIHVINLTIAIELLDSSTLKESINSIEDNKKNVIEKVLIGIIKKSSIWHKIQLISLLLFIIGIALQIEIIILSIN